MKQLINLLQRWRSQKPMLESPPVHPQDVGRILGVKAFASGDIVFQAARQRVVTNEQPYRNLGFVTVTYRNNMCEAWCHCYPADLAFPDDKSLWSERQHQAAESARQQADRL